MATHTYSSAANYTVWMEAFTGVGSVFHTAVIPVYGKSVAGPAAVCDDDDA